MEVWKSGGSPRKVRLQIFHTPAGGEGTEITAVCSDLSISESEGSRAAEMEMSVPDIVSLGVSPPKIAAGDIITIKCDGEDFYIFIVQEASRNYPLRKIKAKDFGLYFEKNEVVVQFSQTKCSDACRRIFEILGVSEYEICEMDATISGVYIDSAEDIIDEIIKIQKDTDGAEYDYRTIGKKVIVYKLTDDPSVFRYKPAENVAEFDIGEHHSRMSYSHSIQNLYNSVKAVIKSSGDDKLPTKEYVTEDSDSISKYGKREKILNVSSDKEGEIEKLAKEELKSVSEIERTIKVRLPGAIEARKNTVFEISDEYLGIEGKMRIKSIKHNFNNGIYTMDLSLEML